MSAFAAAPLVAIEDKRLDRLTAMVVRTVGTDAGGSTRNGATRCARWPAWPGCALGMQVAIDHAGTGHSNLETIRQRSFDKLEVGRQFGCARCGSCLARRAAWLGGRRSA